MGKSSIQELGDRKDVAVRRARSGECSVDKALGLSGIKVGVNATLSSLFRWTLSRAHACRYRKMWRGKEGEDMILGERRRDESRIKKAEQKQEG